MNKTEIRKKVRSLLLQVDLEELSQRSQKLALQLLSEMTEQKQTVLCYFALDREVDLSYFWQELLQQGHSLCFPRYNSRSSTYELAYVRDFKTDVVMGKYGIDEPSMSCVEVDREQVIDIAFIPGIAFTTSGARLGRGKGYYDNLLVSFKVNCKVGVCFKEQTLEQIPLDSWDILMDELKVS